MNKIFIDLALFGANEAIHTTEGVLNGTSLERYSAGEGLSDEMKTYYSDYLIDNAEPALVHDMFAQKINIPEGQGKTIEFRKYDPLPTLTEAISEGVTPTGQKLNVSTITATIAQYGGYVELTDLLILTAIDNNLCMATKLLGAQAGRTLDSISREVLVGGSNVQYGEGDAVARHLLVGGEQNGNNYLTVAAIRRAVRSLKKQGAEKINGSYVAIVHPDCVFDLTSDPNWLQPHQYADPSAIYEGEIGRIEGVRFIESTEAKIFHAPDLLRGQRSLSYEAANVSGNSINLSSYDVDDSIIGRYVLIGSQKLYVGGRSGKYILLYTDNTKSEPAAIASSAGVIYPGEAGVEGRDVYATLVFGENAYGTTSVEGGGLQHIVKQLGSGGSYDPLDQRATVGWKASKVTVRLVEAFMVRIETTASFTE